MRCKPRSRTSLYFYTPPESVIEAWSFLKLYTLQELKGKFDEQELYALIDAYNGTIIEPRFASHNQFIKIQIEDCKQLNQFSQNWKVDFEKLLKKIESLTAAQSYFLLEEINRFWNKESAKENSLKEFVKKFI